MTEFIPTSFSECASWSWRLREFRDGNNWKYCKDLPQYKYIARPVYKLVDSHSNTVIATAASFFVTDLIMHQLLPATAICVWNNVLYYPSSCDISWSPGLSLVWISLALPTMYAKYKKST